MFNYMIICVVLFADECSSAGDIHIKNLELASENLDKSCFLVDYQVICTVKGGEYAKLTGTWYVDGTESYLGLEELVVSLKWSDGVGDIIDISVCQMTGGNFEFVKDPCSLFIVANGTYPQEPYKFKMPNSRFWTLKHLTVSAFTKWSDGSNFTQTDAGGLSVYFV